MVVEEEFNSASAKMLADALVTSNPDWAIAARFIQAAAELISHQQERIAELQLDLHAAKTEIQNLEKELFWRD